MINYLFERTVMVWGEPQKVTVCQKSRTAWIAVGDYMGKTIDVKGSSERSALKLWMDAARRDRPSSTVNPR
jgi:hypothetical protein